MSARSLTFRHMAKAVRLARDPEDTDPSPLGPNEMQLYSYYKPSLLANDYVIEATQDITAVVPGDSSQSLTVFNTRVQDNPPVLEPQEFEVVVPRFALDSTIINSYYPPDGHQDEGRILPHIVFNDPHFPWEIPAGVTENMDQPIDPQVVIESGTPTTVYRNMVPWLALLVFDPEDLHFQTLSDITALNIPGYTQDADVAKQSPNGAFSMKVSDYFALLPKSCRIQYEQGFVGDDEGFKELVSDNSIASVIFPTKSQFGQIFASADDTDTHKLGVEGLKYLAHVRNINTVGFPDAGVEENGLYSIVVSSRTGAYDFPAAHTQVCHLVSIEHVDSTLGSWLNGGPDRVGMISLFSWTYSALPPNPVNFVDTMRNLTENQQMLRTDDNVLNQIQNGISGDGSIKSQAAKVMLYRLQMGYTLARWRTQTGEETAAFSRGPLVPQPVTWPPAADIPDSSNTSQDYQILDPQTGLMDLSYSSAWQAGKLQAISDTAFSAALMRFRSVVHNSAANMTRISLNGMTSKGDLIKTISNTMALTRAKSQGNTGEPERFRSLRSRVVAPGLDHPQVRPTFLANVKAVVNVAANAGQNLYNEFNQDGPNNSDWALIHCWLAEKLSLGGISSQYLIPEPSFVPPEALRFFHIDDFWLDCFLDGALSVANHLDADDDVVRREIKVIFNNYLRQPVEKTGIKPQIPSYGFILRSKLIMAMPDLRITVAWQNPDNRSPVCRWTKMDNQTLMCLLDRQPEELASITLAQPPHQQRFCLGSHLQDQSLTFELRTLYTQGAPAGEWPMKGLINTSQPNSWLNFDTRCLHLMQMGKDINDALQLGTSSSGPNPPPAYVDPTPNSCEFGLELNDPSYYFQILPPLNSNPNVPARNRQLYVVQPPSPVLGSLALRQKLIATAATTKQIINRPATSYNRKESKSVPGARSLGQSKPDGPRPVVPHAQLRMQPLSLALANARLAKLATSVSTLTSKFNLHVYADYKGFPIRYPGGVYDANDYCATENIYFYDLIFSIQKNTADATSSYELLRIDIDIPMLGSAPPTPTTPEPLLGANYDGPGLRMLSNQRFIPFLYNIINGRLHIELHPRSADAKYRLEINDKKTSELGFRLAEANVTKTINAQYVQIGTDPKQPKQPRGVVSVAMTEWYSTTAAPDGDTPGPVMYKVIKNDVQDDSP